MLQQWGIGALVVSIDGESVDGILSERDVVRHLAGEGVIAVHEPVRALMTTDIATCQLTDRVEVLMARMTELHRRHLPVVDDDGKLCGIISIGDVVKSRVEQLERDQAQLIDYVRAGS